MYPLAHRAIVIARSERSDASWWLVLGEQYGFRLSSGGSLQFDPMSVVHDAAVEQRVSYCPIRDVIVPPFDRKLAGKDG